MPEKLHSLCMVQLFRHVFERRVAHWPQKMARCAVRHPVRTDLFRQKEMNYFPPALIYIDYQPQHGVSEMVEPKQNANGLSLEQLFNRLA